MQVHFEKVEKGKVIYWLSWRLSGVKTNKGTLLIGLDQPDPRIYSESPMHFYPNKNFCLVRNTMWARSMNTF